MNPGLDLPIEEWPYLDESTLLKTRSRKVCMTCHLRHHAGVNCIPVLTCQLHHGLIGHGEHLTSRCQGWTDGMSRQQGWAAEVAWEDRPSNHQRMMDFRRGAVWERWKQRLNASRRLMLPDRSAFWGCVGLG